MTLPGPQLDAPKALKSLWFGLVSLLLGPFALWFILFGKLRRRGHLAGGGGRLILALALFGAFELLLFAAPLHWALLLAIYLAACLATARAMTRPGRTELFRFGAPAGNDPSYPLSEALAAFSLAVLPLVYIVALLRSIGELGEFSIRLPSDVYTEGLRWLAIALPFTWAAAWLAWKAAWRPGLRTVIFFYASVPVVLTWIMVWERLDQGLLAFSGIPDHEPVLFAFPVEIAWRSAVKAVFYGAAFLLGSAYLLGAARTSVFAKRAALLGLPSLLLYAHMLFVLGDWNRHLGALREAAYARGHMGAYALLVRAQLARTPDAYRAPFVRDEWMEVEHQSGNAGRARALLERIAADGKRRGYHAGLGRRAERTLAALERPAGKPVILDLPVIKPASYLDGEWYPLLAAVAWLKPGWTDIELRKRLLDLSSTLQLNLPAIATLPEMAPALRQLGVPASPCFLTRDRAISALSRGSVPFLNLYGQWVPLTGWDPARDGFYYHAYREGAEAPTLFRNEDVDLFHHRPGETFGDQRGKDRGLRLSLQKFIPAEELERHVLDIGGVALVLGDSAFAEAAERRAAFLVEQGDVHYQNLDSPADAAACYREAARLHPHEQIDARLLYLERRYRLAAADRRDHRNLFREYPPAWMRDLVPAGPARDSLTARILAGGLGSYLLMNWHVPAPADTLPEARAALDTALRIFGTLRALDPFEPLYLDTLAELRRRAGDLEGSARAYDSLLALHPFGNEYAEYRRAWVLFKLGRMDDLADALGRCEGFASDARYLTMQGAVDLAGGRLRRAHGALARSLKLDKGLGETHALLAEYYKRKGDAGAEAVHRLWLRRST